MFGKSNDEKDQVSFQVQQPQRPAAKHSGEQASTDQASSISRGMTVVGKIFGEGTVQVFGHIEGELRALTVLINEGAQVEGDVVAEELTIAGQVKGTIHANRVKLNSTALSEPLAWVAIPQPEKQSRSRQAKRSHSGQPRI